MTYRQLAKNTEQEIERLTTWLDYSFEPEQIAYWQFQHHGSQKINYEWIKEGKVSSHFDVRWQQDLPVDIQQSTIVDPQVEQYLQSLNVKFEEDGLTTIVR